MSFAAYEIRELAYQTAMAIVVERHYLHRKGPCSIAFGLYLDGELKGVITYGSPASPPLTRGVAGPENSLSVIELTRLWMADDVPKNGESYLIGNTLKRCGKELVVSFADTAQGHLGVVYQATNWLYTGLSAKRTDWHVEGVDKHGKTWGNRNTAAGMRAEYGDKFSLRERPRKHRYVFINAKGYRRRELLAQLRYPVLPYPKAPND